MPVSERHAADLLSRCGRHCCICRRFAPLHLQVHHIIPVSEGGADEPDNLIALCLTCHSDVHTKTPFTRRFTAEELKQDRDRVCRLVSSGLLVPADHQISALPVVGSKAIKSLGGSIAQISSTSIEILISAAVGDGEVLVLEGEGGWLLESGGKKLMDDWDPRKRARYEASLGELCNNGFLRREFFDGGGRWRVTHNGFLIADQLLAAAV